MSSFTDFFEALYGYSPFPWQERLARQVSARGEWPSTLDLPTGVGKTAALDIAVYTLAMSVSKAGATRLPRRIVMVVDRRVIVDQSYVRAEFISRRLREAESGPLFEVAQRLRELTGGGDPLQSALLRGGMQRDDQWARTPHQPLIAVSTVDQVGSRLLFRGYGISSRLSPIHAGLLGNDTLFLLDEVHLSQPFEETLRAIETYHQPTQILPQRWRVVSLSATARRSDEAFKLDQRDHKHKLLAQRLKGQKNIKLVEVSVKAKLSTLEIYECFAEEVIRHVRSSLSRDVKRLGVIVNRVDCARMIYDRLQSNLHAEGDGYDLALVTGRMRPLDRVRIDDTMQLCASEGGRRSKIDRPVVIVSTQTLEAGADLDFEVMITECASLDALRQRLGRVNRMGHDRGRQTKPPSVVLARRDQVTGKTLKPDPIYGLALARTWAWLGDRLKETEEPTLDCSIQSFNRLLSEDPNVLPDLLSPETHAPVLLPGHLDLWAQTHPRPWPDPNVSLWLHGPQRGEAEVSLIWRGELTEERLLDPTQLDELITQLTTTPPSALEAVSLPRWSVARWLQSKQQSRQRTHQKLEPDELSDVIGSPSETPKTHAILPLLCWRGAESYVVKRGDRLKAGETYILPCHYGGLNLLGAWDPNADEVIEDLGDEAQWVHRGQATLRLERYTSATWGGPNAPLIDPELMERDHIHELLEEWINALSRVELTWMREAVSWMMKASWRWLPDAQVLIARRRHIARSGVNHFSDVDEHSSSLTGSRCDLYGHCRDVGEEARGFAQRVGLSDQLADDLWLAGKLHDLGKADPRFQRLLRRGRDVAQARDTREMLAKSVITSLSKEQMSHAIERSGYPRGTRHELLSVALIQACSELESQAHDWELVLHLVGSHHGWCRPSGPALIDPDPREVSIIHEGVTLTSSSEHGLARLDSGVSRRFWSLNRRYGYYGLAWLEAIFRLADHRVSERATQEVTG